MPFRQRRVHGTTGVSAAFARFCHVAGFVSLGTAFVGIAGYQVALPGAVLWPALLALAVHAAAVVALDARTTFGATIARLLVGAVASAVSTVTVLGQIPALGASDTFLVAFPNIALILLGGAATTLTAGLAWCWLGFAVAESTVQLGALAVGAPIRLDVAGALTLLGATAALGLYGLTRSRVRKARPRLHEAAFDDEVEQIRHGIEVRAAALLHDTVLNHLAAIADSPRTALPPRLLSGLAGDLEILAREDWLGEVVTVEESMPSPAWEASAVVGAIAAEREAGLTLEVTGDLEAVALLDQQVDLALALATSQCLENVRRHSGVNHAELVVLASQDHVSLMVIDSGDGFDEAEIAPDRLGIRQSVRARIESIGGEVTLWSTLGRGTSVLLRVPVTGPSTRQAIDV